MIWASPRPTAFTAPISIKEEIRTRKYVTGTKHLTILFFSKYFDPKFSIMQVYMVCIETTFLERKMVI